MDKSQYTIALLLPDLTDRYSETILQGALKGAEECGAGLVCFVGSSISTFLYPRPEDNEVYKLVTNRRFDGIITISEAVGSSSREDENISFYSRYETMPIVTIGSKIGKIPCINIDEESALNELYDHLYDDHKYRNLVFLGDMQDIVYAERRKTAFLKFVKRRGVKKYDIVTGGYSKAEIYRGTTDFLKDHVMPDVFICVDDYTARHLIAYLQGLGLSVPQDVAVTGFDDIQESREMVPSLTTVSQPLFDMGYKGFQLLYAGMQKEYELKDLSLPTILTLRESCGCTLSDSERLDTERDMLMQMSKQKKILENKYETIAHLSHELFTSLLNPELLYDIVSEAILNAGLKSAHVVRYTKDPLGDMALISLSVPESDDEYNTFRVSEILPDKLWEKQAPLRCAVSPLYYQEESLGHMVVELGEIDGIFIEALTSLLASIEKDREYLDEFREKNDANQMQLMRASKLASLGTIASGLAHEVNNPNNFIMMNIDILGDIVRQLLPAIEKQIEDKDTLVSGIPVHELSGKTLQLVDGITKGSRRIKYLVNELKDYSRPQPEQAAFFSVNAMVNSALVLLNNLIQESTAHFVLKLEEDIPEVLGQKHQIEQVIVNLVTNACHALSSTTKSLGLSTFRVKNNVCIRVEDEGVGMTVEQQTQIFDPFFTTKRQSGGSGLGLSISSRIISDHDGRIEVRSKPGRGTVFNVIIPIPAKEKL